nr:zinc finger Ran-binding domain-containing family 2 protein [candidate division Zixibacteria bacterium]
MGRFLFAAIFFVGLFAAAPAGGKYHSDRMDCTVAIPQDWAVDDSIDNRIRIYSVREPTVTIGIFRHVIEDTNRLESDADLGKAISGLYFELGIDSGLALEPEYTVIGPRADFQIEFTVRDSIPENARIMHLRGIVVQPAVGGQVLYLLLAEAPGDLDSSQTAVINHLLQSFEITIPLADDLYPSKNLSAYLLLLLLLGLSAFFYARSRRIQRSRNPLGRDSGNFWRCTECGKINHKENRSCSRCGETRAVINKS